MDVVSSELSIKTILAKLIRRTLFQFTTRLNRQFAAIYMLESARRIGYCSISIHFERTSFNQSIASCADANLSLNVLLFMLVHIQYNGNVIGIQSNQRAVMAEWLRRLT